MSPMMHDFGKYWGVICDHTGGIISTWFHWRFLLQQSWRDKNVCWWPQTSCKLLIFDLRCNGAMVEGKPLLSHAVASSDCSFPLQLTDIVGYFSILLIRGTILSIIFFRRHDVVISGFVVFFGIILFFNRSFIAILKSIRKNTNNF